MSATAASSGWAVVSGTRTAGCKVASTCHDGRVRRLLVLLTAAALGLAAPALADPGVDASFLDALNKAGITFDKGSDAVNAAKTACGLMNQGQQGLEIVQHVSEQNPGISTTSAAKFTAIAASAYCPQFLQRVSDNGGGSAEPPPNQAGTPSGVHQ
jgi:Protein of unknown function (DUF732)